MICFSCLSKFYVQGPFKNRFIFVCERSLVCYHLISSSIWAFVRTPSNLWLSCFIMQFLSAFEPHFMYFLTLLIRVLVFVAYSSQKYLQYSLNVVVFFSIISLLLSFFYDIFFSLYQMIFFLFILHYKIEF